MRFLERFGVNNTESGRDNEGKAHFNITLSYKTLRLSSSAKSFHSSRDDRSYVVPRITSTNRGKLD